MTARKLQAWREARAKAARRAAFFAARDAAFARAGLPVRKIEVRGGVRIETRGRCAGTASHLAKLPAVDPKSRM